MDCSPPGSSVHGDSPGKSTGAPDDYVSELLLLTSNLTATGVPGGLVVKNLPANTEDEMWV